MGSVFQFTLLCFITILLSQSPTAADDVAEPVSKLSRKLQEFQSEFKGTLGTVIDTIKRNRPATTPSILKIGGHTNSTTSTLQASIDKVGKLLHTVADLIWDRVYFATSGGKIMVHSVELGDTRAVVDNNVNSTSDDDGFHGLTYDPKDKKMYFSSRHAIYRANLDGTSIEMVFSSMQYELIFGLVFDWIGGNLYGVSTRGTVFVCKARVRGHMKCMVLLEIQGTLRGIALDPKNGTMYLTADGKIVRANMDGSGSETLLDGLKEPAGIWYLADNKETGLFWVDSAASQLGVLKFDGTNRPEKKQLPPHVKPRGFAAAAEKDFFCMAGRNFILVESERPGFRNTIYNSSETINHLFTPSFTYDFDRKNDCEGKPPCETICVLTPVDSMCSPK